MGLGFESREEHFFESFLHVAYVFWHIFEMVSSVWKHHTTQLRKAILALIPAISIARFSFNILWDPRPALSKWPLLPAAAAEKGCFCCYVTAAAEAASRTPPREEKEERNDFFR